MQVANQSAEGNEKRDRLNSLGGALGRPVWVLAPYSPEWRYGLYWERMPWYPSVRVLRQASPGAWDGLLQRVTNELAAYAPPL